MKKFIILKGVSNEQISIPIDSIISIREDKQRACTVIKTIYNNTEWYVQETVKNIIDKINN